MSWPGVTLQLGLQPLQQGEGVGGAAGEAGEDVAAAELADLLRVGLDHGLAEADLAVAGHRDLVTLAHGKDGGAVPGCRLCHGTSLANGRRVPLGHEAPHVVRTARRDQGEAAGGSAPGVVAESARLPAMALLQSPGDSA